MDTDTISQERTLSQNQQHALAALLSTRTITEAAAECELSERTLHRYLQDPEFKAAYAAERSRMLSEGIARLQQAAASAADVFISGLEDKDADTRIKSARALWEFVLRGSETERRLEEFDVRAEWEQFKREYGIPT